MHKTVLALAVVATLAGCGEEEPVGTQADASRDIAMVERMSREPLTPIVPEVITEADVKRYGLDKPGCIFAKGRGAEPLFIAARGEGFMRIGSDLKRFSAKAASADLPGGARSTYVGLSGWVDVMRQPDQGDPGNAMTWPARMIVHDAQGRVAFSADGIMRCRD